jgi:hypothetical protein
MLVMAGISPHVPYELMNRMPLAVPSNEHLNPWVNWTTIGPPSLHPLASNPDARLTVLRPIRFANRNEYLRCLQEARVAIPPNHWLSQNYLERKAGAA